MAETHETVIVFCSTYEQFLFHILDSVDKFRFYFARCKPTRPLASAHLLQVNTGVDAGYELEYLLLEGHCYESDSGQPPRGLQLLLGGDNRPESGTADTLVMANLVGAPI